MTRLLLLRHAKSDWSEGGTDDHERPLNARGRDAAARIGRYLKAHGLVPDMIVCSTARRTVETLMLALAEVGQAPEVFYDRALYLAAPERMLEVALAHAHARAGADAAPSTLMIVGHNPGTEILATALARAGDPALIAKLQAKYPSGGLAVLACADGLAGIAAGGLLEGFVVPRELS
mgnify:CR=1 FL=1